MTKKIFSFPTGDSRYDLTLPCYTADSLYISQVIANSAKAKETYLVLCADAANAQRLQTEVAVLLPQHNCLFLPDWETLPYDQFSPPQVLISERLATLYQLITRDNNVLFLTVNTALNPVSPRTFLAKSSFSLQQGQIFDSEKLRQQLVLAGYHQVTNVLGHGEFSVRGSLFDLYPMGAALPLRLDLFGNEIDSIKAFDPDSQRSLYPLKEFNTLPAHEYPLDESGRTLFRQKFREVFEGDPSRKTIYKQISQGIAPAGVEYFLPLFFEEQCNIFNYLNDNCSIFLHGNISQAASNFWQECRHRYQSRAGDNTNPVLPPEKVFLSEEQLFVKLQSFPRLQINLANQNEVSNHFDKYYNKPPLFSINQRQSDPLADLQLWLNNFPGQVIFVSETIGRRETLLSLLTESGIKVTVLEDVKNTLSKQFLIDFANKFSDKNKSHRDKKNPTNSINKISVISNLNQQNLISVAPFHFGCIFNPNGEIDENSTAIITEAEIYASTPRRRQSNRSKVSNDLWLRDLSELKIGDPVVHERHGIGRYAGLVTMDLENGEIELLELHYENNAKLFIPVSQLQVISRYSGADAEHAPLHQLGSGQWEKAQKKAALQAYDTAAQLLALYAERAARRGHQFEYSPSDYQAFADGFGFAETPDQAAAIEAVINDMRSDKPMDRLVCGDVGFGKTEVALRAAFCAVSGGKQVVVLTPTTLLCEQHYLTFKERFANWPVNIVEMSRFRSSKEIQIALEGLASGKVDIVIATHKIIASKVDFARLGLVIIDEEHRFGVRQKEKLKQLRAEVDILTLTATPIPRTLAISLEGLRDFSVIATAPEKRLPIKTFVTRDHDSVIREAILRELKRGGQVYFLHNEVSTIESMQRRLEKIVGEAKVIIGHGQMPERVLEQVMRDFTAQRANVLLCTTIIETGIDNPHANTIIIHHAEKFGLAQLHQLRGRVGRSHHQAFAYLLIDSEQSLNKQAKARLESLQAMEELGSGFYLAMHDMEIRGAGEVLGDNQSGEMQAIGFSRYNEMLNRAIVSLKRGESLSPESLTRPINSLCEINLYLPALIPDIYCPDVQERLNLYKSLASANSYEQLNIIKEELVDRFGVLPLQTEALIATHQIRISCEKMKFSRIEINDKVAHFYFNEQFHESPSIETTKLVNLLQTDRRFKLVGKEKISFSKLSNNYNERVAVVKEFLNLVKVNIE